MIEVLFLRQHFGGIIPDVIHAAARKEEDKRFVLLFSGSRCHVAPRIFSILYLKQISTVFDLSVIQTCVLVMDLIQDVAKAQPEP